MTREGVDAAGRSEQRDGPKSERFRLSDGTHPPQDAAALALAQSWRFNRGPTTTDSSPCHRFLSELGRTLAAGTRFWTRCTLRGAAPRDLRAPGVRLPALEWLWFRVVRNGRTGVAYFQSSKVSSGRELAPIAVRVKRAADARRRHPSQLRGARAGRQGAHRLSEPSRPATSRQPDLFLGRKQQP